MKIPEAEKTEHTNRENRAHGVQIWLASVTTLTFIAAAIYAGLAACQLRTTNKTYEEIQKQTTVMRQQMIGTQAAVIIVGDVPRWDRRTQTLTFQVVNTGQLIGTLVEFHAMIQRKSLPSQTPIGQPIYIHITNEEIEKNATFPVNTGLPWLLPELKDVSLWPGKEFVAVDGAYTYNNAFGDIISHKFCFIWMAPWTLTMPVPNQGGWSSGGWCCGQGKEPCRTVRELENEFFGTQRHIKEASTPQK